MLACARKIALGLVYAREQLLRAALLVGVEAFGVQPRENVARLVVPRGGERVLRGSEALARLAVHLPGLGQHGRYHHEIGRAEYSCHDHSSSRSHQPFSSWKASFTFTPGRATALPASIFGLYFQRD